MPRIDEIGVHGPVLVASIVLSVAAAFVISLGPATQIHSHLERGPAAAGRARGLFIVMEIACTVLLLVTAGLLMRSFAQLRATNAGFRPAQVLSLHLAVSRAKYGDDAGVARYWIDSSTACGPCPVLNRSASSTGCRWAGRCRQE